MDVERDTRMKTVRKRPQLWPRVDQLHRNIQTVVGLVRGLLHNEFKFNRLTRSSFGIFDYRSNRM